MFPAELNGSHHAQFLHSIKVVDCTASSDSGIFSLESVDLVVQAYQFIKQANNDIQDSEKEDGDVPQARITLLPSKELDGLWESYAVTSVYRKSFLAELESGFCSMSRFL